MHHLCSLIIVLSCRLTSNAQTVDTSIPGTVSDSIGAAVAGATVVITQPSTGFSHTAVTSAKGRFEIRYLIPCEYVNAGVPLLQTENATITGVVGHERIESLPINGRRFDDLAVLTLCVSVYNPDNHSSSTDGSEIGGNRLRLIHVSGAMLSDGPFRLTGERRI